MACAFERISLSSEGEGERGGGGERGGEGESRVEKKGLSYVRGKKKKGEMGIRGKGGGGVHVEGQLSC